jgi:hypothetical protein
MTLGVLIILSIRNDQDPCQLLLNDPDYNL